MLTVVGFFAGSITNKLGIPGTVTLGSIGYAIYSAAFWVYDRKQVSGFVVAAGAILGCCAAVFWSAQGAVMMAYPEEKNKGKCTAISWAFFNLGGILGSIIALVPNLNNQAGSVSPRTYTAFVITTLIGVIVVAEASDWKTELKGVVNVWREWRTLALTPAFLASNWFYAYQLRVNAIYFDASTRAFNGLLYCAPFKSLVLFSLAYSSITKP